MCTKYHYQVLLRSKEAIIHSLSYSLSINHLHRPTAGDSTILLRRRVVGVVEGDDGVDLANVDTKENLRVGVGLGVGAERNNALIFSLSILMTYL